MIKEEIQECLSDNPDAITLDGLDSALVGVANQQYKPSLAVYDYDMLIVAHMKMGMDREEAEEFVDFNVVGLWAGEGTPLILRRF